MGMTMAVGFREESKRKAPHFSFRSYVLLTCYMQVILEKYMWVGMTAYKTDYHCSISKTTGVNQDFPTMIERKQSDFSQVPVIAWLGSLGYHQTKTFQTYLCPCWCFFQGTKIIIIPWSNSNVHFFNCFSETLVLRWTQWIGPIIS